MGSLKDRGLAGARLLISDANLSLTAVIQLMFYHNSSIAETTFSVLRSKWIN